MSAMLGLSREQTEAAVRADQQSRWEEANQIVAAFRSGRTDRVMSSWPARRTHAQIKADLLRQHHAATAAQ